MLDRADAPPLLKEFFRFFPIPHNGSTIERVAVRAIARRAGRLLMLYSPVNGDYKFPGGGVEPGESHRQALARELSEECGAQLRAMDGALGSVIEYIQPQEPDYDLFRMTSYYYFCRIARDLQMTHLDDYEQKLGLRPVWIDPGTAIATNLEMLRSGKGARWTDRDTFILRRVSHE